ncbi:MAG: Crp/Fnr family transcriptional regulator [Burkholderiaceae bacterium]
MAHSSNQLLARLSKTSCARLGAIGEVVELNLSEVLGEADQPTRHVYFPIDGFISLLAQVDSEHAIEVGMVGREGMLGIQLALGVVGEPLKALVQGAGQALRIAAAPFRSELAANPALRATLDKYIYVLISQHARSAACLRFHMIEQRLARWLLMSQDRAMSDEFKVTQEFLAYMLGVRRVGVTVAAGALQRQHLIAYERGEMTIVNRAGLAHAACSCYASDRAVYAAQFGSQDNREVAPVA